MSAFNTVVGLALCPQCGRSAEFEVQVKYGDTWQYCYAVGDKVRWGGNDVGTPGHKRVLVEGIGGPCPLCRADALDFDVLVEDDQFTSIVPAAERRHSRSEGFVVLEP
jgi:hypothetical protein